MNIKVVCYNIQNGQESKKIVNNIKKLIDLGTEIFCLQEVRSLDKPNFIGDDIRAALSPDWEIKYFCHDKENIHDFGECVIWNKNKLRFVKNECFVLKKLKRLNSVECLIDQILIRQQIPIQRGAIVAEFTKGKDRIRVINLHLDWQGGEVWRLGQLKDLMDYLSKTGEYDKEIICGDFNSVGIVNFAANQRGIEQVLDKKFVNAFPKLEVTTNSWMKQKLDQFYVNGFKVKKSEVLTEMKGSDHYPLLVSIVA